jgi:hypothetical protein
VGDEASTDPALHPCLAAVAAALRRDGWAVNHKRVLQVMREQSLLWGLERRWGRTTDSARGLATCPNLVKDLVVAELNAVWVADITDVRQPRARRLGLLPLDRHRADPAGARPGAGDPRGRAGTVHPSDQGQRSHLIPVNATT